eukprot:SAG22_NODE_7219_length_760_cov_1.320726_2_plen_92_part_00
MASGGRTSARYPLHARLSPADSVALLKKRKARKERGVFASCSCNEDGDDAPPSAAADSIMQDARVAEAITAAKKAEVRTAPYSAGRCHQTL